MKGIKNISGILPLTAAFIVTASLIYQVSNDQNVGDLKKEAEELLLIAKEHEAVVDSIHFHVDAINAGLLEFQQYLLKQDSINELINNLEPLEFYECDNN